MSRNVLADAARHSLRILAWQLGWVAAVALICSVVFDTRSGGSILVGGSIGLIWAGYMAFALFKHSVNHGVRLSAASFLGAWLIKLALTVGLLVVAFRSQALVPLAVLAGLFTALLAYWAWLAFDLSRRKS